MGPACLTVDVDGSDFIHFVRGPLAQTEKKTEKSIIECFQGIPELVTQKGRSLCYRERPLL